MPPDLIDATLRVIYKAGVLSRCEVIVDGHPVATLPLYDVRIKGGPNDYAVVKLVLAGLHVEVTTAPSD